MDRPANGQRAAVAGVGVGDQGDGAVEGGEHGGVGGHVVERGEAEVGLTEAGDGCAGAGLGGGWVGE